MTDLPLHFIYIIYTTGIGITALVLVPKRHLRELAFQSIILGGLYDVFWILLLYLLGAGGYQNYGPFGFLMIPFFPPIAWTIFFMMYLYILPKSSLGKYLFALIGAMYSTLFSNVLHNLGIFRWNYGRIVFPFMLYLVWLTSATYLYDRYMRNRKNQ